MNSITKSPHRLVAGLLSVAAAPGIAAASTGSVPAKAPDTQRNFIACPVVMDTEDVPCWVAEYEGERYYLTVQSGRGGGSDIVPFSPMVKHQVLVEGTVSDEPRICGGIVLRKAKLSPLEDVDPECGKTVPGEGYRTTGPRPIGPDGDPPGPRETTAINYRPAAPLNREQIAAAYKAKVAAREPREFEIHYFFNSNYLPFPLEQRTVDEASKYAEDINASRVEIVGYRGLTVLSNGERAVEKANLAQARARKVADIMEFFKVPAEKLKVTWKEEPEHNGGVSDYVARRVTIKVVP
jgi:outer membrane protein OmpA-like peptidoglycan-associated protein